MLCRCLKRLEKELELIKEETETELYKVVTLDPAFHSSSDSPTLNWRIVFLPMSLHKQFELEINFPTNYPFEPPVVKFVSFQHEHPNIDAQGNICMDLLKLPPKDPLQKAEHPTSAVSLLHDLESKTETNSSDVATNSFTVGTSSSDATTKSPHDIPIDSPIKKRAFSLKMSKKRK